MKSKFFTELDADLKEDSDEIWILNERLIYYSESLDFLIDIPKGFETDFASVPRIPIIYSLWGARAHREGVLHDYLFRINSIPTVSFSTANGLFLEAMKSRKKSNFIAYPMYWGVVTCSYPYYHKRKVRDKL